MTQKQNQNVKVINDLIKTICSPAFLKFRKSDQDHVIMTVRLLIKEQIESKAERVF